jgi:hypothetical protein
MRDWMDCPEAAGPQGETEDFSTAEFAVPGWRIGSPPVPARDPAAEAILRNLEAERAADLFKSAPPDALDLTVPVTTAPVTPPKSRPHRRTRPAEPEQAEAGGTNVPQADPEPASPPEETP